MHAPPDGAARGGGRHPGSGAAGVAPLGLAPYLRICEGLGR